MSKGVLNQYRNLSLGGIGLIISGGFPAFKEILENNGQTRRLLDYSEIRVQNMDQMPKVVHKSNYKCKIFAQVENGTISAGPSDITSLISKKLTNRPKTLSIHEINDIIDNYVQAIIHMKDAGFDGVQLHAAHGGLLSRFLSPYTNRRKDNYGGSISDRANIVKKIVSKARKVVNDFPIIIKMNCTDNIPGGIDEDNFPDIAKEIQNVGIDAIEISGGMWDCLFRDAEELGFRPVPAPESHTRINHIKDQSYYLKYVRDLNVKIPLILTGGNRSIESLETILTTTNIDFIGMSRPLIREPDLPNRWFNSHGDIKPKCISCNSCIYSMYKYPDRLVTCIFENDHKLHRRAQTWLKNWVEKNKRSVDP
jgi:2,4-dienoyl-CoA reductase-like NADH-dependent reductase (Old Yellow Enzyme family)